MFRYKLSPKSARLLSVALSVAISVFLVVAIVEAATTISTNIVTNGTLTVDTTSTLTGDVTAGADLIVTSGARVGTGSNGTHLTALAGDSFFVEGQGEFDGIVWFDASLRASTTALLTGAVTTYGAVTLGDAAGDAIVITGNASTTNSLTVGNDLYVNGYATTTGASGNFATAGTLTVTGAAAASSTLQVTGAITIYGNLTINQAATTTVTFSQAGVNFDANTFVIDPNANRVGVLTATPNTAFEVVGSASTTDLRVGGFDGANSLIAGMVFGTCNINPSVTITASTTGFASCSGATGVRSGDRLFVTATSSLDENFIIQAASSSAVNVIQVRIYNSGIINDTSAGPTSLYFWAAR